MLYPPGLVSASDRETCDPAEAPAGFYAVPKPEHTSTGPNAGNICRQCDWRSECQKPTTDLLAYGHRCMSNAVHAVRDGLTYRRRDQCSVIFKRRHDH